MKYQGLRLLAEYGSGNSLKAAVSYYAKFQPRLAMSWSGHYSKTDGFFDNKYSGADCDTEEQVGFRWKTQWRISDNVNLENDIIGKYIEKFLYLCYNKIDTVV